MNRVSLIGKVLNHEISPDGSVGLEIETTRAQKVENAWLETKDRHVVVVPRGSSAERCKAQGGVGALVAVDGTLEEGVITASWVQIVRGG